MKTIPFDENARDVWHDARVRRVRRHAERAVGKAGTETA